MTNNNAKESIAKIKDELADLDEPLARVRDLAYAVRMLASSDEMQKEPGAALDAMAETTSVTSMASCISCHQAHNAPVACATCHAWPPAAAVGN